MPFVNEHQNPRARTLLPTEAERERPDFFDETVPAAFRQENTVANIARTMREQKGFEPEEDFDPFEYLRGTPYEGNYIDRAVTWQSRAEAEHGLRQIAREEEDRETIAASGFAGIVASIAAGIIDPTIALPGGALYRTARGGVALGRTALSVGAAGGAAAGVAEGVLSMTQETRTREEAALNIGASVVLSGLLGGGAGALVSRGERRAVERLIDADIAMMESAAVPEVPTAAMRDPANSNQVAAEAGAAPADQRGGRLVSTALDSVFGPAQRSPITAIARSPTQSLMRSEIQASRRIVGDLAESPLMTIDAERGIAPTRFGGPTADREIRLMQGQTRIAMMDVQESAWVKHRYGSADSAPRFARQRDALSEMMGRSAPGKLTYAQFDEEVGRAMRQGDTHPIPEVAEAAQARRAVFDEWRDRAIRAGLYGEEGADPRTAPSYFPRIYLKDAIIERKPQVSRAFADWLEAEQVRKRNIQNRIEELEAQLGATLSREQEAAIYRAIELELEQWGGKSARDALSSIRARDKAATGAGRAADAPRLRGADRDIRSAVRRIIGSDRMRDRQELEARADEIVDRIVGTPAGRLPYDEAPLNVGGGAGAGADAPRGALARREFMIPDQVLEDLDILDNSAERAMDAFLRTTVPDIVLTERFGDFSMSVQLKGILDEANTLIKQHPARAKAITAQSERDLKAVEGIRDRLRGVYSFSSATATRNAGRIGATLRFFNMAVDLGGAMLSSIPDSAGMIFRWGFTRVFGDGYRPFVRSLAGVSQGFSRAKSQYRAMMIGAEMTLMTRSRSINDIREDFRPGSKFERAMQVIGESSQIVNLNAPWTEMMKGIASIVSGNEIFRAARAVSQGKASAKQIRDLAASGIDEGLARRIWAQFEGGGEVVDGVYLPNTADWQDRAARLAFEGAVARETDIVVTTPGQEKPLWMSDSLVGLIGQHKSFIMGATERILLANLQRRDAHTLAGFMTMISMGMVSAALYSAASGKPLPERPQDWVKEGISRSGVLGWLDEANSLMAQGTAGGIDIYRLIGADRPLQRFSSRSVTERLFGPTLGKINTVTGLTSAPFGEEGWNARDTSSVRRLMPYQNLFMIRRLLNQVEDSTNELLGIQPLEGGR